MSDALTTYLHDHLTGSHFAVKLLDSLSEQYQDEDLGNFAVELCTEIKEDQQTLQTIIDRVGPAKLDITEAVGWVAEKASRLKLGRNLDGLGLGTFEALETLTLGIRGKLALWRALFRIRELDSRVPALDFNSLVERAEDQYTRTEQQRLMLVDIAFRSASSPSPTIRP